MSYKEALTASGSGLRQQWIKNWAPAVWLKSILCRIGIRGHHHVREKQTGKRSDSMVLEHRGVHIPRKIPNKLLPKSALGCEKTRSWRDGSSLGSHIFFNFHFRLPGWLTEASKNDFSLILMTCVFMFVYFPPPQPILPLFQAIALFHSQAPFGQISVLIDWFGD